MPSLRSSAVAFLALYPWIVGYGGPNPFHVAPFRAAGGNFAPGAWVESGTVSKKDEITIVVMASWCPHCARLIDDLAASSAARSKLDMILFFDDENGDAAKEGRFIQHPDKLAGRSLPFYFAKGPEFEGLYEGFPTILACTKSGCTQKDRTALGLD
jgi:thiol-disulfide isomerase/thioredoxin